ncbi:membrane-spanning 4-domains subfamily A member 15 [Ictalurus punctatus]|uniref:Membrane-spanning 4-domains subfamily A member 15 n=1 Tax=Ictalurus punctatus TaxID=7998 RepID=A0A2D0S0P9_ICTPU|nr:membrane-spanning 4-domains subfamily A member 15 [Ictalurus punctatus]XP_053540191.1 membrane-spanning 4-domains subfamily A member 15 [Ictalurus punctatus]
MPVPAMKVDPKSLGTVQIMIGTVIFMFGIVTKDVVEIFVHSGVMYWGSLCFIISGALSTASVDHRHPGLVKSSLVMNMISAVAAIVAIVVFAVDLVRMPIELPSCNYQKEPGCIMSVHFGVLRGTFRVLLVFSVLEVCMSIWTFVLTLKSRGSTEATS